MAGLRSAAGPSQELVSPPPRPVFRSAEVTFGCSPRIGAVTSVANASAMIQLCRIVLEPSKIIPARNVRRVILDMKKSELLRPPRFVRLFDSHCRRWIHH
jgi:hypothetical protein